MGWPASQAGPAAPNARHTHLWRTQGRVQRPHGSPAAPGAGWRPLWGLPLFTALQRGSPCLSLRLCRCGRNRAGAWHQQTPVCGEWLCGDLAAKSVGLGCWRPSTPAGMPLQLHPAATSPPAGAPPTPALAKGSHAAAHFARKPPIGALLAMALLKLCSQSLSAGWLLGGLLTQSSAERQWCRLQMTSVRACGSAQGALQAPGRSKGLTLSCSQETKQGRAWRAGVPGGTEPGQPEPGACCCGFRGLSERQCSQCCRVSVPLLGASLG